MPRGVRNLTNFVIWSNSFVSATDEYCGEFSSAQHWVYNLVTALCPQRINMQATQAHVNGQWGVRNLKQPAQRIHAALVLRPACIPERVAVNYKCSHQK
jgi:hypothetical protein